MPTPTSCRSARWRRNTAPRDGRRPRTVARADIGSSIAAPAVDCRALGNDAQVLTILAFLIHITSCHITFILFSGSHSKCLSLRCAFATALAVFAEAGAVRPDRRSEGEGKAVAMPGVLTKGAARPAIAAQRERCGRTQASTWAVGVDDGTR